MTNKSLRRENCPNYAFEQVKKITLHDSHDTCQIIHTNSGKEMLDARQHRSTLAVTPV